MLVYSCTMIQELPTKDLRKNLDNPRNIKEKQFEKLKKSIKNNKNFFNARPIICTSDMVIVAGNQRYHAAVSLKMKTVPVFILPESITPEEIDQISLLDNHNNGQWDYDKLFETYDGDYLQDIGFTDKELGLIDDVRIVFAQDKYVDNTIDDVAETEFQHDKRKEIEDEANRIAKERYENEKAKIERETKEKFIQDLATGKEHLPDDVKGTIVNKILYEGHPINNMSEEDVDIKEQFNPMGHASNLHRVVFIFENENDGKEFMESRLPDIQYKKTSGGQGKIWQVNLSQSYGKKE